MKRSPARVLLVESERYFLEMVIVHLEANFDVVINIAAGDGEAIAAISMDQAYDLIITGTNSVDSKFLRYLADNSVATPTIIFSIDSSGRRSDQMQFVQKPLVADLVRIARLILRGRGILAARTMS